MSGTIMQSLTFIVFIVSEKIATLKFLPHIDTSWVGWPNTDYYIDWHFSSESTKPSAAVWFPFGWLWLLEWFLPSLSSGHFAESMPKVVFVAVSEELFRSAGDLAREEGSTCIPLWTPVVCFALAFFDALDFCPHALPLLADRAKMVQHI